MARATDDAQEARFGRQMDPVPGNHDVMYFLKHGS